MSERKYKFQKVVFQSDQVGIDIRGGYCSQVRKSSQAYKLGVRPGWRIVNIDGERVPREDREIASLIRACIDAGEEFPVTFRLPPTSTYAGYKCGDVVEALDSTGRQWNKCLIIDIVDDKFSIVYLHNAVRSKKYQAMLRRVTSAGGDDWEADFDEELDGEAKSKKKGKGKKDKGEGKADTAIKKLLKAAIGKEAKSNPKEMIKEYSRVSSACSDKHKCKEVVDYIEGKLEDHKYPTRVLKALLLTSYLLAYADSHCAKLLLSECSEAIEEAAQLNKNAKTAAGKAAVADIKERVGPQIMALLKDPNALARLRKAAKKQNAAKLTLAPPPGEQGAAAPTTQQETEEAFANLSKLTSKHVAAVPASANLFEPAPQPKPVAQPLGGINLDEIFGGGETTTVQQQPSQMNQINQGMANMGVSSARGSLGGAPQQQQQQQNLWQSNLVDLGTLDGTSPTNPQTKASKKITLQQMQGEEVDLFSF
uniref:ENTH domain-containing protein n=1 Tax=Lotharella oceanica TaxID=641309 RepID=A0A7S2XGC9_9EUKA|mmetsp:Transcript_4954/g.9842  ORF Transcript_4954/g.9842 Transcript_4954/m.9842 type:complete len:480 (+) Transcript_4954:50-1489(+)